MLFFYPLAWVTDRKKISNELMQKSHQNIPLLMFSNDCIRVEASRFRSNSLIQALLFNINST